jgi:hypothetical protein
MRGGTQAASGMLRGNQQAITANTHRSHPWIQDPVVYSVGYMVLSDTSAALTPLRVILDANMRDSPASNDESTKFWAASYLSAGEEAWRILGFHNTS